MSDQGGDRDEKTVAEDADEKEQAGATTAADDLQHAHEGNAHDDYTETGEETRAATQKWGANSPGSNTIPATGESPSSDETEKLPNEN